MPSSLATAPASAISTPIIADKGQSAYEQIIWIIKKIVPNVLY